jgi:hypothetical protein
MRQLHGLNIDAKGINANEIIDRARSWRADCHLVMDGLALAGDLYIALHGYTLSGRAPQITYRSYAPNEDQRHRFMSASDFINWFRQDGRTEIYREPTNEPIVQGDDARRLFNVGAELAQRCVDTGWSLTWGGLATAAHPWSDIWPEVPEGDDPFSPKYAAARQQAIDNLNRGKPNGVADYALKVFGMLAEAKRPDGNPQIYMSYHEYTTGILHLLWNDPKILLNPSAAGKLPYATAADILANWRSCWLIFRHLWFQMRAAWLKVPHHNAWITESPWDRMPNLEQLGIVPTLDARYGVKHKCLPSHLRYFQECRPGQDPLDFAIEQLDWWSRTLVEVYRQLNADIAGYNHFTYAAFGEWLDKGCSLRQHPDILKRVATYAQRLASDTSPIPPPRDKGEGRRWRILQAANLREGPGRQYTVLRVVTPGDILTMYNNTARQDSAGAYRWVWAEDGKYAGWIATEGITVAYTLKREPITDSSIEPHRRMIRRRR